MTRFTSAALLLAAGLLLAPVAASAQGAGAQACNGDLQRFCAGAQQGGGQVAQCLTAHQDQLSPGCRDFLSRLRASGRSTFSACRGDVRRLCPGIQPGGGRIIGCISAKRDQLSPGCASALNEASGLFSSMR